MNQAEYLSALSSLGLTRRSAAEWLGYQRRHGIRIATGTTPVSAPAAKLLRLTLALGMTPQQVDKLVETHKAKRLR